MVFSIRKKTELKQVAFNVQEIFNIWDMHTYVNWSLEQLSIWTNLVHDPDLRLLIDLLADGMKTKLKDIDKIVSEHKLMGLSSARKKVYIPSVTDNIFDENIASWLLSLSQEQLEMMLRILRTTVTNDSLRQLVTTYIKGDVNTLDKVMKHVKLKGWIKPVPLYPDVPKEADENIDCGEAYHIWDHLTFRYANIEYTQSAINLTHDGDFKLMLKKGLQDILQRQAAKLEDEIIKFGLPMPCPPPENTLESQTKEIRTDQALYNQLLQGMEAASILHAQAIKQCMTNDRLRHIFSDIFLEELDIINNLVKFGKVKGWLSPPPSYRQ